MKRIDCYTLLSVACDKIKFVALLGTWSGIDSSRYLENCKWFLEQYECILVYTRDVGYHSGGWWKNPDYERCFHLSLSWHSGKKQIALDKILNYIFGSNKNLLWIEPPYSEVGKKLNVYHYRLFCDENWLPIKPRGEVYSIQFTERGWKSFSELKYEKEI